MSRVNEGSHLLTRDHTALPATYKFIHKWHESYLPLLPSRRASPHFSWYSFPVQLRVGGWVGRDADAGAGCRWFSSSCSVSLRSSSTSSTHPRES